MISMRLPVLGLVLLASPLAAQFPSSPPVPGPVKPAAFPPFQEAVLPNGLRMIVVARHKQPVLSVALSFPSGSATDPAGKEGLADFVAGLLTKGAGNRSADEISAAIEGVGGSLNAGAGRDFLTIGVGLLSDNAPLAFELVSDAAMRPTFPDKEVDLLRTQTLSALQLELSQPASLATRTFARELYGAHPYGASATPASVKAITRADLTAFQSARLRPGGALLVVSGDITLARARELATSAFAGWSGAAPATAPRKAPPVRTKTEIVLVNRPASVQSNILVGNTTFGPMYPQFYAATVANRVLGGGADSRLFDILREKKSWTYGAYSNLRRYRGIGSFVANTEVRTEVTDSALVELMHQLKRMGTEPVSAKDLASAKNSLVGRFPLTIETADQVATAAQDVKLYGLPADYLQTYRTRLAAVTPAEIMAASKSVIRADRALIVVVGDGAKVYPKLKAAGLGPVRIVSPEGDPLTPDDLVAKAGALDLEMGQLAARRDSFTVMVQGNPLGWERMTLEKTDGGWKYSEDVQIGGFVQQTTEMTFTDKIDMQVLKQTGKVQGMDTKGDATYGGGRVKGSAITPAQGGPKTVTFDTTITAGTIDDNAVTALLPALKWADGAKISLSVFSTGKGLVEPVTLTVGAKENLTVPAGTFEAWRVEVAQEQPISIWITTAAPHRLIKLALAGAPLEFVLAK